MGGPGLNYGGPKTGRAWKNFEKKGPGRAKKNQRAGPLFLGPCRGLLRWCVAFDSPGVATEPSQPASRAHQHVWHVRHPVRSQLQRRRHEPRRQGGHLVFTQHQSDDFWRHIRPAAADRHARTWYSIYMTGQKSDSQIKCQINCKTPDIFTFWTTLTFALNHSQFKGDYLFQNIFIILSEPRCVCTRRLWIKQRSSLVLIQPSWCSYSWFA